MHVIVCAMCGNFETILLKGGGGGGGGENIKPEKNRIFPKKWQMVICCYSIG